jgi:hypothetical protein
MSAPSDGATLPLIACSLCGMAFEQRAWQIGQSRWCRPCRRKRANEASRNDPEKARTAAKKRYAANPDYFRNYAESRRADPEYRAKRAARRKVATEIEAGRLSRQACEVCGDRKADAHHDDYAKPLDVAWLCHRHHMERHAMLAREVKP